MVDFRIDVVVNPQGAVVGARAVGNSLGKLENQADRLRTTLVSAFGVFGTGALLGGAIRSLAAFEQAMATVRGVSGATAEEFAMLEQAARDLGVTTRFTATEAADALVDLARAGFSTQESLAAVGDTLVLATAGGLGLSQATDIAASALRGFRLSADQTGRVADVLAATANKTNTNVQELGDALKFVAPIAASVGISFEETNAALGLLSNAGLKASLAGTGLKRVISELEGPTAATQRVLQQLGLTSADVRVSQVGLTTAIERLKEAGVDAGLALQIFGDRGGPAFEVFANAVPQMKSLTTELENAGGTAKQVADIMNDNLGASIKFLGASFEALIISIGKGGGSTSLKGLIDGLSDGLRFLAANADRVIKFVENLALFFGPRYLLGAIRALGVAIAANPLGLLLTVIAAVAAAVPDLQTKLTGLVQTLADFAEQVTAGLSFQDLFQGVISGIDTVVAYFNGLVAAGAAVFYALSQQPEAAGQLMKKAFRDTVEAIIDFFLAMNQTVGQIITGLGRDVVDLARNVGGAIGAISSGNLEAAQAFADNLEGTLVRSTSRIANFTNTFSSNLKKLRGSELLPEVELSNEAFDLGNNVAAEFRRAVEESQPTAAQSLDFLLGPNLQDEAARRLEEAKKNAPAAQGQPFTPPPIPLSSQAQEILNQIDANKQLAITEDALNEIYKQRPDLLDKLNTAMAAAQITALEASTALEDGFTRAFLKLGQEAQNLAAVGEQVVMTFADRATDAISEFTKTGTFDFKKFASSVLEDLSRILIRLIIIKALSAAAGVAGVSADTVNTGATLAGGGGGRARGGTVQPDRSYVVGENGPEIFQPGKTGTIVPNSAPAAPPQVNVQVVNVDDPNKVPQAISSGQSDEAIINLLARNKDRVSQVIR